MKTLLTLGALLVLPNACKGQSQPPPSSTNASPQSTLTDAERAAGWRLLFDGKTTAGWRNYGKQTISDGWVVQDGALTRTGTTTSAPRWMTVTSVAPSAPALSRPSAPTLATAELPMK